MPEATIPFFVVIGVAREKKANHWYVFSHSPKHGSEPIQVLPRLVEALRKKWLLQTRVSVSYHLPEFDFTLKAF